MAFTFPKNYKNLSQGEKPDWNFLKKIFKLISAEYNISKAYKPSLSDFEIFNSEHAPKLLQAYTIQKESNQFTLCLIEYDTSHQLASVRGGSIDTNTHKYLVGHLKTKNDLGNALMRPEHLTDKISEFFSSIELDIDGFDGFNRKYYLLTSDKHKFKTAINAQFLNSVAETKNVTIEFAGKKCLFRLKKAIDLNETLELCKIGIMISKTLNQ